MVEAAPKQDVGLSGFQKARRRRPRILHGASLATTSTLPSFKPGSPWRDGPECCPGSAAMGSLCSLRRIFSRPMLKLRRGAKSKGYSL